MTFSLDRLNGSNNGNDTSLDMVEKMMLKILVLDYEIKHQAPDTLIKIIERKKSHLDQLHNEYKGLIKKIKNANTEKLEQEVEQQTKVFLSRRRPFASVASAHSAGYLALRIHKDADLIQAKKKYTEFIAVGDLTDEEKQSLLIQLLLKERNHET